MKIIAYASKRLPEAAQHCSITELELCGLVINIVSFDNLLKMASHAKTNGTVLPKVHGIDKGVDSNVKPNKQIMKPLVTTVQSHVPTESKDQYCVKPRLGQGRTSIKKKMLRFHIP